MDRSADLGVCNLKEHLIFVHEIVNVSITNNKSKSIQQNKTKQTNKQTNKQN